LTVLVERPALRACPTRRSSDLGRVGVPKEVIDAAEPVVEVDKQMRPRRPFGDIDRLLDYRFGDLRLSLSEIGRGQDQLRAGSKLDRKSTCLNSSHQIISYAVFC